MGRVRLILSFPIVQSERKLERSLLWVFLQRTRKISGPWKTRVSYMELSSPTSAIQRRTVRNAVPQVDAQLVRGRGRLPAAIATVMEYATVVKDRGLNHVGIAMVVENVEVAMGVGVGVVVLVTDLVNVQAVVEVAYGMLLVDGRNVVFAEAVARVITAMEQELLSAALVMGAGRAKNAMEVERFDAAIVKGVGSAVNAMGVDRFVAMTAKGAASVRIARDMVA